jgi:hypothetical protein
MPGSLRLNPESQVANNASDWHKVKVACPLCTPQIRHLP